MPKLLIFDAFTLLIRGKTVSNYALLCCKTFSLKIWVCKFFDKFHVCLVRKPRALLMNSRKGDDIPQKKVNRHSGDGEVNNRCFPFCSRHVMGTLMPLITSHMSKKRFSRVILINRFVLLKVYRLSIFIICFIYKKSTTLIFQ